MRDIQIPASLVRRIEGEYISTFRHRRPDDEISDHDLLGQFQRKLLPIHVWLEPLRGDVLENAVRFSPPVGGGEIDLANFVRDEVGKFQVGMAIDFPEGLSANSLHVYYLVGGRERALAGDKVGAPCGHLLDLKGFFRSTWLSQPLVVYTRQQRYVSVLAGTYLFVIYDPPRLWLAALAITDSRYPQLLCP
jgi:hypothetical protein